jgi:heat-inducible transcriptional repressor
VNLSNRKARVLQSVVELYISSAAPVSSAAIVESSRDLGVSTATIRHIMAELEEAGLLKKPHKSAGRIPTETGLRAYLNQRTAPALHWQDRKTLDSCPVTDPKLFPVALAQKVSQISGQLTVVALPKFSGTRFKKIGLVRCAPGKLLVWFVSPSGLIQQTMVEDDFGLSNDDLLRTERFLNEKLSNRTLAEVRLIVDRELKSERARYDAFLATAMEIGRQALPPAEYALYVDGASSLAKQPEFANAATLHRLLSAIEERENLLELLDNLLRSQGVQVVLGSEHQVDTIHHLSCVGSLVDTPEPETPILGVLGPARMDYPRLIPVVGYASELLSNYWNKL